MGIVVIAGGSEDYAEILAVIVNTVIEEDLVYLDKDHQHKLQLLTLPYTITQDM